MSSLQEVAIEDKIEQVLTNVQQYNCVWPLIANLFNIQEELRGVLRIAGRELDKLNKDGANPVIETVAIADKVSCDLRSSIRQVEYMLAEVDTNINQIRTYERARRLIARAISDEEESSD